MQESNSENFCFFAGNCKRLFTVFSSGTQTQGYNKGRKTERRMQMKRCSRVTAMALALGLLVGVTFFAGATRDDAKVPSSVQEFVQMCG